MRHKRRKCSRFSQEKCPPKAARLAKLTDSRPPMSETLVGESGKAGIGKESSGESGGGGGLITG